MNDQTGGRLRARGAAAVVLTVVGSLSLILALVSGWAQRSIFDNDEFANRAVAVLDSATVRRALAEEITDEIIKKGRSSLASYRAELVGVVEDVLTTDGFRSIFRGSLEQAHRAVFQRNSAAALLELGETLELVSDNARSAGGSLASSLPSAAGSLLIDITPTVRRLDLWRFTNDVRWLDDFALALTAIAFVGAILLDRRRHIFVLIGIGVSAAGIVVALIAEIIPDVVANTINDPPLASAISAGAGRFVADLKTLGLWTIPFGILVAVAADAGARDDRTRIEAGIDWIRRHPYRALSHRAQLGLGLATLAVGVVILAFRHRVVPLAVLVAGSLVVYRGAVLTIRAISSVPAPAAEARPPWSRRLLVGIAGTIVLVLLAGGLVVAVTTARSGARERGVLRCNGSADLCDRRLDQVTFAGSHNSMSAESDPGWLYAENLHGIPAQLEYGIRALLIKSHYGINSGISVAGAPLIVTDKAAEIRNDPDTEAEELGADAVATVRRIQQTVGQVSQPRDVYLCHGYCELGATKFSDVLSSVRQFMNRNPNDVVMMVIGDYVTPADTERAFKQARLIDRVWTYDPSRRPPTLRRMIERQRTLLVFSEHGGGTPPWYNPAYTTATSTLQDTPYTFAEASEFSCAPNRGPADAPLFQINHWITNTSPPNPKQAAQINSSDSLNARVKECMQVRKRFPSIIGVNFYDRGDLLEVVDDLNRRGATG